MVKRSTFFIFLFLLALTTSRVQAAEGESAPREAWKTIMFSGYQWSVRSGSGGPGPNYWSDSNAWVDSKGYLHLQLTYQGGKWYCAEVVMKKRLGFGTYQFQVIGWVDRLDPNVVLGLFNYGPPDVGPDTTNEIDIELSRWGDADYPDGRYTVWPAQEGLKYKTKSFDFSLTSPNTTHRFIWDRRQVRFQSQYGHRNDSLYLFQNWLYAPAAYTKYIPQHPMPVYINLWLMQGLAPLDGKPVTVVIKSFKFTPK